MGNPLVLYDNIYSSGTITATGSGITNYLIDLKTYTFWQADDTGIQYIKVACDGAKPADCIAIAAHNLKSAGVQVSVEASNDDFVSDITVVLAPFSPNSDKPLIKKFTALEKSYWRVKIAAGSTAVYIGVLMLGLSLEFPFPPNTPYTPGKRKIVSDTNISRGGHFLGSILRFETVEIRARFSCIDRTWAETYLTELWDYMKNLLPFFWAWDYAVYPNDVELVRANPNHVHEMPLSVLSYVDSYTLSLEAITTLEV